jgi:anaerobic magnesium-protoporphyrin IX monomethyl ester cyclase
MNIASTRGCPYHCNWCAKPIWGQRYNVRSPENVVDEIATIVERFHPDHFWFVDDIFGLKQGWIRRFAELVRERGLELRFKSLSRADLLLRPGEVEALRDAGCEIVWIGAESGSQAILDAMEKGTKVAQIEAAAAKLKAAGVKVGFFLQFGYPGETLDDIEETFRMIRRCSPDDIGMSVSYPLPGTKFYRSVEDQLGQTRNWKDSNDFAMLYSGPYPTRFYRQLHPVLHKEFRSRKIRSELASAIKSPSRLEGRHLRRAATLAYYSLSLPIDRWKLSRIAAEPYRGLDPIRPDLSPELASQPSAQQE